MFLKALQATSISVGQIGILAAVGYVLMRRSFLKQEGLDALSRLVMDICLPFLIFSQLIEQFHFEQFPGWWQLPLWSVGICIFGFACAAVFMGTITDSQQRCQFSCMVAFQNSGFMPLALIATIFTAQQQSVLYMYLFLFLVGFNLLIFSFGVYVLTCSRQKRFALSSLLNPPVIAAIAALGCVWSGVNQYIPHTVVHPIRLIGDCTLPLALLVVGGNLAQVRLAGVRVREVGLIILLKNIVMPAVGLAMIIFLKLPALLGVFLLIQLAMPSATTPSVIIRQYQKDDLLVSHSIFFGHLVSIITVPIFLSIYLSLFMLE